MYRKLWVLWATRRREQIWSIEVAVLSRMAEYTLLWMKMWRREEMRQNKFKGGGTVPTAEAEARSAVLHECGKSWSSLSSTVAWCGLHLNSTILTALNKAEGRSRGTLAEADAVMQVGQGGGCRHGGGSEILGVFWRESRQAHPKDVMCGRVKGKNQKITQMWPGS